jgi:histidinol-phosphate aminotransferase
LNSLCGGHEERDFIVDEKLLRRNIIIRPLKGYGLPEWVRISVGTMPENEKCVAALRQVMCN